MFVKTIKVKIPATTANCGPGFDSIGIACTYYNELEVTELDTDEIQLEVSGEGEGIIPATRDNIVCQAIDKVFERVGHTCKGLRLKMENNIPLARGMGSSAAAIVGGLFAANELSGSKLTRHDLFELATEMEGHPDNVAPAIFGGITVSIMEGNKPSYLRFMPPKPLYMIVAIPEFHLATKTARSVLPIQVPREDAIFNLSRTALLVTALSQGKYEYLSQALEDKLHQPYRMPLIKGMEDVVPLAKEAGAYGCVISGAGPSLIAFAEKNPDDIGQAMVKGFNQNDVEARYVVLQVAEKGARISPK
jgi:homoserine kinase